MTCSTGLTTMPECRCRTKWYKLTEDLWCRTELFISIPASMVLVHLHVHGACPCPCFMFMLNIHVPVHVYAAHHRCVCMCKCKFVCVFVCTFVFVCITARTLDYPASDQSGTGMKKLTMPGQVRYRPKPRQSGIFLALYRTEIFYARMPMPVLVFWMPMPSYANYLSF